MVAPVVGPKVSDFSESGDKLIMLSATRLESLYVPCLGAGDVMVVAVVAVESLRRFWIIFKSNWGAGSVLSLPRRRNSLLLVRSPRPTDLVGGRLDARVGVEACGCSDCTLRGDSGIIGEGIDIDLSCRKFRPRPSRVFFILPSNDGGCLEDSVMTDPRIDGVADNAR